MRRILLLLCGLAAVCHVLRAQTGYVMVNGTRIVDAAGHAASNATLCGQIIMPNLGPSSVLLNGGGHTITPPVCTAVASGGFTINLPDTSKTTPANACIAITVTDNLSGNDLLGPGYGCVQPTSAAGSTWCFTTECNFDMYPPNLPALGVVSVGPIGPQGLPGCLITGGTCSNAIATSPTATQSVTQPPGTSYNIIGSSSVTGVRYVSAQAAGAEMGAPINAAAAALSATGGGIVYVVGGATVSTMVTLPSTVALALLVPLTWTAGIQLSGTANNVFVTCPAMQTIQLSGSSPNWITLGVTSTGAASKGFGISNCSTTGAATGTPYTVVFINGHQDGTAIGPGNRFANAQIFNSASTASSYSTVSSTNSPIGVDIFDNVLDNVAFSAPTGTGVLLDDVIRANVHSNVMRNVYYGVQWFGGDACLTSCAAGGGNGALGNPRNAIDYVISDNNIQAAQSCIWGSMGHNVKVGPNNTCTGSGAGDVGIDFEGSEFSSAFGNTVSGYPNGDLTTFWLCNDITFGPDNHVFSAGEAPYHSFNSTQSPNGMVVRLLQNDFNCTVACAIGGDAVEVMTIDGGRFKNVSVSYHPVNGNKVLIRGVDFYATVAIPNFVSITGLTSAGTGAPAQATVDHNTFESLYNQASGSAAVYVNLSDFNYGQLTEIINNHWIQTGQSGFPVDISCVGSTANSAAQSNTCDIYLNRTFHGVIQTTATGNAVVTTPNVFNNVHF